MCYVKINNYRKKEDNATEKIIVISNNVAKMPSLGQIIAERIARPAVAVRILRIVRNTLVNVSNIIHVDIGNSVMGTILICLCIE